MGHLTLSFPEAFAILLVSTLLMWAPVFGFAYVRRRFDGAWQNYLKVYLGVCALTVGVLVLMTVLEDRVG